MPLQNTKIRRGMRFILLACLAILCAGLIMYSVRTVRYSVGSENLSELTVTELSLTHSVERGPDGKLVKPKPDKPAGKESGPKGSEDKACPT